MIAALKWIVRGFGFARFFIVSLLAAQWQMARAIANPSRVHSGWVRMPTRVEHPWEATLLAVSISLTPGTLVVEWDREAKVLWIHTLFLTPDPERLAERLQKTFEAKLLYWLRGEA